MLSKVELLADAWQSNDPTKLGRAIAKYLSPGNSKEPAKEPLSPLDSLADAWQSDDSTNLGRAIAQYLSPMDSKEPVKEPLSPLDSLADAWRSDDSTNLGRAIAQYLSPMDSKEPVKEPLSPLDSLADAWRSDDSTNLGRAIAQYLSEFQTDSRDLDDSEPTRPSTDEIETQLKYLQADLIKLNRGKAVFLQPPQEILRSIFAFVIPPAFLLDPAVSYGPESPWCQSVQAKNSLINVCWAWYYSGIDMLYQSIGFRNVCQVSALLRTLQNHTSLDFGSMIKEIGIHCLTPMGYSAVFRNDLDAVIAHAPRLSSVLLRSPESPSHFPIPIAFKAITHLDCGPTAEYATIHQHIGHLSSSLISLSIHLSATFVASPPDPIHAFPHLETLRCSAVASSLPLLAARLILPSLKTLIFPCMWKVESEMGDCLMFCRTHGRNLRTLSFWPAVFVNSQQSYRVSSQKGAEIQNILAICPHLEHLIIPGTLSSSPELSHPKVKWIDFWTIIMYLDSDSSFEHSIAPKFPAVKGIRQIVFSGPLLFGHIPTVIPPHLSLENPFEFDYPGVFLRHGNNRIYRNDAIDFIGAEYEDDDESDGDYEPSDTGSSGSASDDDSESAGSTGNDGLGSEWEADHESTLALYDQLQNSHF